MRPAICAVVILLLVSSGCGYVGPVLPPSAGIPASITDLSAVQRGGKIIVTFNTPPRTTDGVAITNFSHIELRVMPERQPSDAARSYSLDLPAPNDRENPLPQGVNYSVDVSDWSGQRITLAVRTSQNKTGHFSGWSNQIVLDVIPPLERPVVHAEGSPGGVVLTWPAIEGVQYNVQRQAPTGKQPDQLATVNDGHYVDISAAYDTPYTYTVTAKKGSAESVPSEPVTYSAIDKYPPAVPSGLTALAGANSVDVAWQRNAESDFQGYSIYRSTNGGPYERQGNLIALPTYSDHNVEHGKTYSYEIAAVDKKGNESAKSAPAEVQY